MAGKQQWQCPVCLENKGAEVDFCEPCKMTREEAIKYQKPHLEETEGLEIETEESSSEAMTEIVEGYWFCPNCESKNMGAKQNCSACGAVRGENVEFYCDDDAPAITDEAELAAAKAGPDWICEFCGNTSPSGAKNCTGCGSSRSDGKKRKVSEESFSEETEEPVEKAENKKSEAPAKPAKPLPFGCQIGCGIFVLLFLVFSWLSCSEKAGKLEIVENSWTRTIQVEEYKNVVESAWKNEVPAGATRISSKSELKRHDQIPDGYENVSETYTEKVQTGTKRVKDKKKNLGNGRFEFTYKNVPVYENKTKTRMVKRQRYRKVPVYDEKVTYSINRWMKGKIITASGKDDEPAWPEIDGSSNTPAAIGDKRAGEKKKLTLLKLKKLEAMKSLRYRKSKMFL